MAGPSFDLNYNYVAPSITANGQNVDLKIGVPNPGLSSEIRALQLYGGCTAVQLLDYDEAHGEFLLEHLSPGTNLATMEDDLQATRIAAKLIRELWRPLLADFSFPTTAEWA